MSGLNINNKNIVIGREVGTFNSKKDAVESSTVNPGSEIIYQKDNKWHVDEVKDKGIIYNSSLSKTNASNIQIDTKSSKNVKDVTISFVEADVKPEDKTKLARSTSSQYVLDKLADEKPLVRGLQSLGISGNDVLKVKTQVAANHNASPETLEKLAQEDRIFVKAEVAKNPNTSAKTLAELAKSESSVTQYVAANHNTSANTLKELYQKKNFSINKALASNPNTPADILKELVADKSNENNLIKPKIAANPNAPVAILDSLAKGSDDDMKKILLDNPSLSKKTKHDLLHKPKA